MKQIPFPCCLILNECDSLWWSKLRAQTASQNMGWKSPAHLSEPQGIEALHNLKGLGFGYLKGLSQPKGFYNSIILWIGVENLLLPTDLKRYGGLGCARPHGKGRLKQKVSCFRTEWKDEKKRILFRTSFLSTKAYRGENSYRNTSRSIFKPPYWPTYRHNRETTFNFL